MWLFLLNLLISLAWFDMCLYDLGASLRSVRNLTTLGECTGDCPLPGPSSYPYHTTHPKSPAERKIERNYSATTAEERERTGRGGGGKIGTRTQVTRTPSTKEVVLVTLLLLLLLRWWGWCDLNDKKRGTLHSAYAILRTTNITG